MYIYKKEDNLDKIQIFSFNEDKKQAHDFREEEIKKIRRDRRCFYYKAILPTIDYHPIFFTEKYRQYRRDDEYIGRYYNFDPKVSKIFKSQFVGKNRSLKYYDFHAENFEDGVYSDADMIDILSNDYINGDFVAAPVLTVDYINKLRYFLLTSNYAKCKETDKGLETITEGIVEIPKSLYLLQMLEQEKYNRIKDENVDEQLELFDCSYVDVLDLEEIERIEKCGLAKNLLFKTTKKIENDELIVRKLKL